MGNADRYDLSQPVVGRRRRSRRGGAVRRAHGHRHQQRAESFKPGCSALFVLVRKATGDKVLAGLSEFTGKGKVLQTSLTKDKEEELRKVIEGAS